MGEATSATEALLADLNLGMVFHDPLGHPAGPPFDELQRGFPVRHVLLGCGRCTGTLEFFQRQVELNLLVVVRHEVLEKEEGHELLEPAAEER